MENPESSAAAVSAFEGLGAELFDPSGMQRPFKDWVEVPLASSSEWPGLADAALAAATV